MTWMCACSLSSALSPVSSPAWNLPLAVTSYRYSGWELAACRSGSTGDGVDGRGSVSMQARVCVCWPPC